MPGSTSYAPETPKAVRDILDAYMGNRNVRLAVHYGDTETGEDWMDIYDVEGYIGRSTGTRRVPLLIHNTRSMGGSAILDHCIIRIRFANRADGGDLYRHPNYHADRNNVDERLWNKRFA